MSGTTVLPQPSNESEVQLYHILQRANLLQYYNTFISQGGDDVQQLCEAGEEEFLEIMALVGMASKPLHVRRLQKALQEWAMNPLAFQQSLGISFPNMTPMSAPPQGSIMAAVHKRTSQGFSTPSPQSTTHTSMEPMWTAQTVPVAHTIEPRQMLPSVQGGPVTEGTSQAGSTDAQRSGSAASGNAAGSDDRSPTTSVGSVQSNGVDRNSVSPHTGEMSASQMKALADAAEKLAKTLPQYEARIINPKKQINKEIEEVIHFTNDNPDHPDVIDLMRKYAAIYGRFDSKRKGEKPMSHHEISVNEAAAQLSRYRPALLTRRDDLFPLARQVVRMSGYQYSKGHSRAQNSLDQPVLKKMKIDTSPPSLTPRTPRELEQRLAEISQEMSNIAQRQDDLKDKIEEAKLKENLALVHTLQTELETLTSKQLMLLTEQSDNQAIHRRHLLGPFAGAQLSGHKPSVDDEDSFQAYSDSLSPINYSDASSEQTYTNGAPKTQANGESLFDAGMKIAEQFGLGEFARELRDLQGEKSTNVKQEVVSGNDDDELDKQTTHENTAQKTASADDKSHCDVTDAPLCMVTKPLATTPST